MNINYYVFINFLFDRDQHKGEWRYNEYPQEPELTGEEVTFFVKHMLDNYDSDLSQYSDWQLALGFGLHGLGHMELYTNDVPKIIRKFLKSNPNINVQLKKYAKNAEYGCVL
ncbi:MAG: hypothetical protein B0W54_11070 [Cellvibrio sp. 79]|nr:MAG: hypothetical protein B0W54_11070 [Cellvibrio sp. 79]